MRGEQDFAAYVEARGPALVRCLVLRGLTVPDAEAAAAEAFASLRDDWPELAYAGDLDDALFGGVLGTDPEATTALLEEAATLPPLPLPYDRVRAVVAGRRRRQWLTAGGLVAAATAVALVWSLVDGAGGSRPTPRRRPRPGPGHRGRQRARVSCGGPTARCTSRPPTSRSATCVAWSRPVTRRRTSTAAAGSWRRTPTGTALSSVGPRVLAAGVVPAAGLVAWVDASRTGVQRMVVWDCRSGVRSPAWWCPGLRTEPTGFDGGWLTFRTGTTDYVWNPHGGQPIRTGDGAPRADGDRWAVPGRHRRPAPGSSRSGLTLRVVRKGSSRMTYLPGVSGALSGDGRLVITRPVDRGEPRLYDARTGERLDTWYPGGWRVLDATFVGDDRVAWLADRDDGQAVLVVCGSPGQPMDCAVPHDLGATGTPVIARDSLG